MLASCILGEKKQVTSKKVSIDTQLVALRGKLPKATIKVYFTTDGSQPTQQSNEYKNAFEVEPGTTVRALVVLNGEAVQSLEERFAEDEGFVFDAETTAANPGGNQAEDAAFNIANIATLGSGFNGKGYLDFGRNSGGYVEWYQENDGSKGEFNLKIRYSANSKIRKEYKVLLTINGDEKEIALPGLENYRKNWVVYEISAQLNAGANTIRITALEDDGLCIDELNVR